MQRHCTIVLYSVDFVVKYCSDIAQVCCTLYILQLSAAVTLHNGAVHCMYCK